MKKVMFALCFMFGGIVVVSAQDTQDTTSNQYRTETQSQYPQDSLSQDMSQDQSQSQDMMGQQDRERIQVTELPDEVKRSLEGQEYRGWLISGAFKAQSGDQSSMESDTTSTDATQPQQQESANATGTEEEEVYIVELKNGAETKTVRFDSKGEVVEGMEGDQNGQSNENGQTPGNQYNQDQSTTDPSTQPDQSQSSQSADPAQSEQSTGTPSGQSTETQTQSEQSTTTPESQTETQTDQSKANEPK